MAHPGFDLVDLCRVDARLLANRRGGLARDDAGFGQRVARGYLHLEPLRVTVFVAPQAGHLRPRITWNHTRLPFALGSTGTLA